jgi:hypothetical protein
MGDQSSSDFFNRSIRGAGGLLSQKDDRNLSLSSSFYVSGRVNNVAHAAASWCDSFIQYWFTVNTVLHSNNCQPPPLPLPLPPPSLSFFLQKLKVTPLRTIFEAKPSIFIRTVERRSCYMKSNK